MTLSRGDTAPLRRPASQPPAKFVTGSILRHILVMTGTSAVGLIAIFIGDLANIFFLSRLGDASIVAALGYASVLSFFSISFGVGLSIAAAALVSPAVGAGRRVAARRLSVNAHILTFLAASGTALVLWLLMPWLLSLLGAKGRAHELAVQYLTIVVPSLPLLALGMTSSAVLRSVGDASRSMHVTLAGAVVTILLDPIFIFALGLGLDGAAIVAVLSRAAVMGIGLYGVLGVHRMMGRPRLRPLKTDAVLLARVAVPAVLTNVATPFGNAIVTTAIATFGDSAVAGWAIIGRIIPVAFGGLYSLSGAIGPIIGQNFGAQSGTRMLRAFDDAILVVGAYTLVAWLGLALLAGPLVAVFKATGAGAELIVLFCRWLAPLFAFLGALFVANAVFNTLGRPRTATLLNWGRATLGTWPFVMAGAALGDAGGVLAGNLLGGIAFGLVGAALARRHIQAVAGTMASRDPAATAGGASPVAAAPPA